MQRPTLAQATLLSELSAPLLMFGLGTIVQPLPVFSSIRVWKWPLSASYDPTAMQSVALAQVTPARLPRPRPKAVGFGLGTMVQPLPVFSSIKVVSIDVRSEEEPTAMQ